MLCPAPAEHVRRAAMNLLNSLNKIRVCACHGMASCLAGLSSVNTASRECQHADV